MPFSRFNTLTDQLDGDRRLEECAGAAQVSLSNHRLSSLPYVLSLRVVLFRSLTHCQSI